MKKKTFSYLPPAIRQFAIRQEDSFCASYTGPVKNGDYTVNEMADIEEVDISGLWNN